MNIQQELNKLIESETCDKLVLQAAVARINALHDALNAVTRGDSNWSMNVSDDNEELINYLLREGGG